MRQALVTDRRYAQIEPFELGKLFKMFEICVNDLRVVEIYLHDNAVRIPFDLAAKLLDLGRRAPLFGLERTVDLRCDLIEPTIEFGLRVPLAFEHHAGAILSGRDVLERIRVEQDQIGPLSFFDRSNFVYGSKKLVRVSRSRGEDRVVGKPGIGERLQLAVL